MSYSWKKVLALCCAVSLLAAPAYARVHGGMDNEGAVEIERIHTVEEVDLAVNMEVDGLHPKYSNRVPESWHPVDTVEWQVREQDSPQLLHRWPVKVEDTGGTLLFSDSPEYVEQDGILYSDVVEGAGRIFYYHLNNTHQNKKIAVVLENAGPHTAVLNINRAGLSEPSKNYLWVGKTSQQQYMDSQSDRDIFVFAGRRKLLDNVMDETVVKPGQLVNGIYDFTVNVPVRLSVIMYGAGENPLSFIENAKVLPKDEHRLRGTYRGMNRIIKADRIYNPAVDGAVFIPLADNDRDLYRVGIDATDGSETQNYGNYGIMYELQVPVDGDGDIQYMLNPLGGVYAGAMTVKSLRDNRRFLLSVPRNRLFFGEKMYSSFTGNRFASGEDTDYIYFNSELEDLGSYSGREALHFEFSPPGASNLPVNFILMPATQAQGLAYKWQTR